ncbi:MAG: phytanoyl-CoA dioxygenase family protein [Myxococcota bacterium]
MSEPSPRPRPPSAARMHAAQIRDRGYTVLPSAYAPPAVARLRAALEREYEAAGRPVPVATGHIADKGTHTAATAAGFAVSRLLSARPEVAPDLLVPAVVEVLRAVLGSDMHLELAGGLLSDPRRPFFKWHNHLGGIDDRRWQDRRDYPRGAHCQRILMLLYLEPLDPDAGSLLVLPRRMGDPVEAPHPIERQRWEGQVEITAPVGSAVLLDEATWHAALPQRRAGLRMVLGLYFAAATAPRPAGLDRSLVALPTNVALLASVLPPPEHSIAPP